MHHRCSDKGVLSECERRNYFERGIKVCARWDDFWVFLTDMGRAPDVEVCLDRIDSTDRRLHARRLPPGGLERRRCATARSHAGGRNQGRCCTRLLHLTSNCPQRRCPQHLARRREEGRQRSAGRSDAGRTPHRHVRTIPGGSQEREREHRFPKSCRTKISVAVSGTGSSPSARHPGREVAPAGRARGARDAAGHAMMARQVAWRIRRQREPRDLHDTVRRKPLIQAVLDYRRPNIA